MFYFKHYKKKTKLENKNHSCIVKTMKLPKKITPCPIIEAVVEIRFNSTLPKETIIGLFYSKVKSELSAPRDMAIMKLPSDIREQDKNLQNQPYYEFRKENLLVRLGPKVLVISNVKEYLGWQSFFSFIKKIVDYANSIELISSIERVGVRYINFFPENIIGRLNVELKLNNELSNEKKVLVRIEDVEDNVTRVLNISNSAQMKKSGETAQGTVIDIDCVQSSIKDPISQSNIIDKIDIAHTMEKEYFYRILTKDFIKTLNPEYED